MKIFSILLVEFIVFIVLNLEKILKNTSSAFSRRSHYFYTIKNLLKYFFSK